MPHLEELDSRAPIGWAIMSDAALKYVAAFTHPLVTDVARDLLEAIARLIPEGQDATPPVGNGGLATHAHVHRRTVCRRLPLLVELQVVRIVDGGNGRPARFALVHLAPAPLTNAALPLRADLQPVPKRPQPRRDTATADLFAEKPPPVRSPSEGRGILARILATVTGVTGWPITGVTGVIGVRSNDEKPVTPVIAVRSDGEQPVPPVTGHALPLDVAGTRARAVQQPYEDTTTAAPLTAVPPPRRPEKPCRWTGGAHAWCVGRRHVPMGFHLEERRKLGRAPGETDADLDRRLFARYAAIMAAIPETQDLPDETEFTFWKRMLRLAPTSGPPAPKSHPLRDISPNLYQPGERRRHGSPQ